MMCFHVFSKSDRNRFLGSALKFVRHSPTTDTNHETLDCRIQKWKRNGVKLTCCSFDGVWCEEDEGPNDLEHSILPSVF